MNASEKYHRNCSVHRQRHLVSEMTECDSSHATHENRYECYLKVTRESRESNACMFS